MAQYILTLKGTIVPRRSVRRLRVDELALSNETEASKRSQFDAAIRQKLGDSFTLPAVPVQVGDTDPDEDDF